MAATSGLTDYTNIILIDLMSFIEHLNFETLFLLLSSRRAKRAGWPKGPKGPFGAFQPFGPAEKKGFQN